MRKFKVGDPVSIKIIPAERTPDDSEIQINFAEKYGNRILNAVISSESEEHYSVLIDKRTVSFEKGKTKTTWPGGDVIVLQPIKEIIKKVREKKNEV